MLEEERHGFGGGVGRWDLQREGRRRKRDIILLGFIGVYLSVNETGLKV